MDAEKALKLGEKYKQSKEANVVLKKGLLEKQELCARLEQQLKEKDANLRTQLEELDHLQFQNARLTKNLSSLTAQMEEMQKQKQGGPGGWSMGGLINGNVKEQVQRAEAEIRMLQDHLSHKIEENEDLHRKLFEAGQQYEEECRELREANEFATQGFRKAASDLEAQEAKTLEFQTEAEGLANKLKTTEVALAEATASSEELASKLRIVRSEAERRTTFLELELRRLAPFDDTRYSLWAGWDRPALTARADLVDARLAARLEEAALEACGRGSRVLSLWGSTFGTRCDYDPPRRAQVRQNMLTAVETLADVVGERLPAALRHCACGESLHAVWGGALKNHIVTFLRAHRKWVTYQCLLLATERPSSSSGGGIEAAGAHNMEAGLDGGVSGGGRGSLATQAMHFVDCLWRAHRSLRTLVARLRLSSSLPSLLLRKDSSAHFAFARDALRRPPVDFQPEMSSIVTPNSCSRFALTTTHSALDSTSGDAGLGRVLRAAKVGAALDDLTQSWEAIGRCLSKVAAGGSVGPTPASSSGGDQAADVLKLLESVHRLCAHFHECVLRAGGGPVSTGVGSAMAGAIDTAIRKDTGHCTIKAGSFSALSAILSAAPASLGDEEARRTQVAARQLASAKLRLITESRQQARRLGKLVEEKTALAAELGSLQDKYAVLQQNFQYLNTEREACSSLVDGSKDGDSSSRPSKLVSMLDGFAITPQEGAKLRQHGYFVDVLALTVSESVLVSNPPNFEAPLELAIRKVYEQLTRSLRDQIIEADAKATQFFLSIQQKVELLKEQEEAKNRLRDEVLERERQLAIVRDDIITTRKNYDAQMAMLTEHICSLSSGLSERDAGLSFVQTHKVLCGHCGTWNSMGKLMANKDVGTCQTCKEKVLVVA